MKLTKEQKKGKAKELAGVLKDSPHIFFTQYQGLKFQEMGTLRQKLKPAGCSYHVVKNSLLSHALKQAGIAVGEVDGGKGLFGGPNAIVFSREDDPVSPAKILYAFAKEFESLKVKAGYIGGEWMTPDGVKKLSMLGTRPEQLGQLANALYSSVAQGAWVLAAPIRDLVLVLKALEEKKKAEGAA